MKAILLLSLLIPGLAYAVPQPGDSVADQVFSLSPATSGSVLTGLAERDLADFEGKVVVLAYFTPW